MKALFQRLKEEPNHTHVFFTKDMSGWLLTKNNRHPIQKTRAEVLSMEDQWLIDNVDEDKAPDADDEDSVDVTEYLQGLEAEVSELREYKAGADSQIDAFKNGVEFFEKKVLDLEGQILKLKKKKKPEDSNTSDDTQTD